MEVGSSGGAQVCNYATWHSEENKRKSIVVRPPDHGHCAPLGMGESCPGGLGTTGKGEDSSVECGENVIGWTWCRVEVPGGGIWLLSRKRIKGLWLTTLIRGIF
jgi:hypothetical protein